MAEFSKQGFILLNGIILTKATQVRYSIASNDKPVRTLTGGLEGFSDGAEEITCDWQNAVPLAGFEAEFHALCRSHRTVRIAFKIATKTFECEGRFLTVGVETDVDSPNGINVSFHGRVVTEV